MKSDSGLCRQFCSSTGLLIVLISLSSLSLAQDSSELLDKQFSQAFKNIKRKITLNTIVAYPDSLTKKAVEVRLDSISEIERIKINSRDSITPQQVRQDILTQLDALGRKYRKLKLTSGLPFYEVIELKLKYEWLPDRTPKSEELMWLWILVVSFFVGLIVGFMGRMYYEKRKAMQTQKEWKIANIDENDYNDLLIQIKNITGTEINLTKPAKETIKKAIELLKDYKNQKPNENRSLLELVEGAPQSEQNLIKEYLNKKNRNENDGDVLSLPETPPDPTPQDRPEVRKEYFYFGSAGVNREGKALFDSQDAKSKNADRVFYELMVEHNNPEKAEVKLIETFLDDNFSSFVDLTVERVCTIKNTRSTNHTKIRTATSGKAEKVEGDWVVIEKVIVEYV
jgi:hypothetical protein